MPQSTASFIADRRNATLGNLIGITTFIERSARSLNSHKQCAAAIPKANKNSFYYRPMRRPAMQHSRLRSDTFWKRRGTEDVELPSRAKRALSSPMGASFLLGPRARGRLFRVGIWGVVMRVGFW
ncbi:hypothetical protein QJS10_CPB20g01024 [Acorus calamus]|uniref:Uncharacterized protein n=1 Tax=Acorus calamus TaxID=4465 RepID=A0AAV9C9V5_ACOCL|nr:hypothetical protein QJS10_CPB20g01024 [Acorus calamus]